MDPLIYVLITAVASILGGGGVVGLLKLRTDNASSILKASQEWSAGVATTAQELLVPLTDQLSSVRERLAVLEREIVLSREAEEKCQAANAKLRIDHATEMAKRDQKIAVLRVEIARLHDEIAAVRAHEEIGKRRTDNPGA